jgi:general secretion pathway protein K
MKAPCTRGRPYGHRAFGGPRQKGVALIIALILVALAAILATKLTFDGFMERQRTVSVLAGDQAMEFALGAEALAADVLTQQPPNATQGVTLSDAWAQPMPPMPITPQSDPEGEPIGTLQGSLEDMQGRFNLNNLGHFVQAAGSVPAGPDPAPLLQFQRLLVAVGLEPKFAQMAQDWIVANNGTSGLQAATGDSVYMSQTPPYRAGQFPMTSPSELMNLPGFDYEHYRKIARYVTALPNALTAINLCTAPAVVLESLAQDLNGELGNDASLATGRKAGCFPDVATFQHIVGTAALKNVSTQAYGITSQYFRLTTRVTLGTSEYTLYSLLTTTAGGKVTPILRSFGTT